LSERVEEEEEEEPIMKH